MTEKQTICTADNMFGKAACSVLGENKLGVLFLELGNNNLSKIYSIRLKS